MSQCTEVLFVSDCSGRLQTTCCFDPHIGTSLMTYKGGGGLSSNTLGFIGDDYLVSANNTKPMLQVWPINNSEPLSNLRMITSGKASALTVSPDGFYCVAGIDGKIYIWQVSSGALLNVISKHYQAIKKIVFFSDSTHFVTCGNDGLVLVWRLADVVEKQSGSVFSEGLMNKEPVYTFSHHALPVTDVYLGGGNARGRLFSVSVDQTCKVYSLSDGSLLLSIVFDFVLTSVVANAVETELFVGTKCGRIVQFGLDPFPRSLDHHPAEGDLGRVFEGHEKAVTCLALSIDGHTMASGAEDERVAVWDIPSRQLLRTFEMKGSVTNLSFRLASDAMFAPNFEPRLTVSNFQRMSSEDSALEAIVTVTSSVEPVSLGSDFEVCLAEEQGEQVGEEEVARLKVEVERLKTCNKQLYQFAMEKILNNPMTVSPGAPLVNGD